MLTYAKFDDKIYVQQKIIGASKNYTSYSELTLDKIHYSHKDLVMKLDDDHILVFGDTSVRGNGYYPKEGEFKKEETWKNMTK